jgi:uncharacterized protein YktB (UPF0637 family)
MSLTTLLPLLCSAAFGTLITLLATRKKTSAETQLFNTEIYSTMLGDLRAQLNLQGEQLKNQAQQILNLQKKEIENVRVINQQQKREREHLAKIKQLETTIRQMESKINHLQYQLYGKQK